MIILQGLRPVMPSTAEIPAGACAFRIRVSGEFFLRNSSLLCVGISSGLSRQWGAPARYRNQIAEARNEVVVKLLFCIRLAVTPRNTVPSGQRGDQKMLTSWSANLPTRRPCHGQSARMRSDGCCPPPTRRSSVLAPAPKAYCNAWRYSCTFEGQASDNNTSGDQEITFQCAAVSFLLARAFQVSVGSSPVRLHSVPPLSRLTWPASVQVQRPSLKSAPVTKIKIKP